ncbi:hypothetical protein NL676_021173 [Syzygium grande]|nr:hypothetical protein NL676_021173 [Syzygium grande]
MDNLRQGPSEEGRARSFGWEGEHRENPRLDPDPAGLRDLNRAASSRIKQRIHSTATALCFIDVPLAGFCKDPARWTILNRGPLGGGPSQVRLVPEGEHQRILDWTGSCGP